jgi:hypothetical protein
LQLGLNDTTFLTLLSIPFVDSVLAFNMKSFFALSSFVALTAAYQISSPGGAAGWTTAGPNSVAWTRVSTDPLNFTIVLSNQNITPSYSQVLDALVDGTLGNITVNPPSTGFPTGDNFQVNFVQDSTHLTTIYAQSQQFSLKQSNGTSTTASTPTTFVTTNPTQTTGTGTTDTDTNDLNPTGTTTSKNGADRTKAAGGISLIFGALAAMVL